MTATTVYDVHQDYWLKKTKISTRYREMIEAAVCPDSHVLDLGCGGGKLGRFLQPRVAAITGIDFSEQLVTAAQERLPELIFVCGDVNLASTWDQLDQIFDVDVVVSDVAIRKDGCRLEQFLPLMLAKLKEPATLVFRVQADKDLEGWVEGDVFYSEDEIRSVLGGVDLSISVEEYVQRFSTVDYFKEFLEKIGVQRSARLRKHRGQVGGHGAVSAHRQYFLIQKDLK